MGGIFACFASSLCECACCMACSCFSSIFSASLAKAARFGHLLVILVTFAIAIILGKSYPQDINGYDYYTKINLTSDCNSEYSDECIYRQLIYRASCSLFILFFALAFLTGFSDYVNKSFWIIKFGSAIGVFIAFWWGENHFFSGWAEFARIVSFFWLLVQGLLLLDFSHDIHDILMSSTPEGEEESSTPYVIYLGASFASFFAAVLGLVYLFKDYAGCDLGMFFIVLTLVMGVLTTIVSLLDSVGKGLLTPCLMFAYSVFMCWYALLSNPDESCNPTADYTSGSQDGAIAVIGSVSLIVLIYCVMNGTKILNIFNPEGEGVMMSYTANKNCSSSDSQLSAVLTGEDQNNNSSKAAAVTSQPAPADAPLIPYQQQQQTNYDEYHDHVRRDYYINRASTATTTGDTAAAPETNSSSGTVHERVLFHVMMLLVCCYIAMILTNWGKTNGSPAEGTGSDASTSNESMWLKIVSQWVFLILYCRVLQVSYYNNLYSSSS